MFSLVPNDPLTCGSRRRVEVGHGFVHIFCLDFLFFCQLQIVWKAVTCQLAGVILTNTMDRHLTWIGG